MYLSKYQDQNTGVGQTVSYQTAHANALGTPVVTDGNGNVTDDRLDPFYCDNQAKTSNSCKGTRGNGDFANTDYESWSVQAVSQLQALGTDSSSLKPATITYNYALPTTTNTNCNGITGNNLPAQENDCVGDYYLPEYPDTGGGNRTLDTDWQDYYHEEFRGFNIAYITSPAGNLTADYYYTAEGWYTPATDALNYNGGRLYQEDTYWGNQVSDNALLTRAVSTYTGTGNLPNSCDTHDNLVYAPCVVMAVSSKTTFYEGNGTGSGAPWVEVDKTYDDYNSSSGLVTGSSVYHHLLSSTISASNAAGFTNKLSYQVNDQTSGNITYHTIDAVSHSELDDSQGHVWQCQDTTYDEGASGVPTPAAGLATTTTAYSDCTNKSGTAIKSYTGYDAYGNVVSTVDPFGAANSGIYGNTGCTPSTAPAWLSGSWTAGHYTTCTAYDSYLARPVQQSNAFNQQTKISYDYTQGGLPSSTTDLNGQTTSTNYSYDSSGNPTTQIKLPGESGSFSKSSSTISNCSSSSTLPCYEIDTVSAQYPNAVTRTFYDSQGRKVETRTPGPDAQHDTVAFTYYDEANNAMFQSLPFRVASGKTWIDPNGAKDDSGAAPAGTAKYFDPLGRVLGIKDPLLGSSAELGITCSALSGTWSSCNGTGIGGVDGDSNQYSYTVSRDANNHMAASFQDALGRERYTLSYSQSGSVGSNITAKRETQYNVLGQATTVIMTDLAPQAGQTITQVTSSAAYNDLGELLSTSDPDTGKHTYTYDADGRPLTATSGTHTLGSSYDLLGRALCLQDVAPTTDGSGKCNSSSHPLVQATYDTNVLGTQGNSDFPIGRLTRTIATTYYPDGSSATVTQQAQYDQRGRQTTATLQIGVPASWNVTTALPTYQLALSYNDDNQLTETQTSAGGQTGYTFSQAYDSTTGQLTGLSNNATGAANLATTGFNSSGLISDINLLSATGTTLANDHFTYDADQSPLSSVATWQSGSGTTGTIFSQNQTYDPVGNVTSLTTTLAAIPGQSNSGGSEASNFCYDEENRLVWAGNNGTQPAAGNGTCGTATLANTLNGAGYNTTYAYTHLGQIWQGQLNGTGAQQQYLYCDNTHPHQLTGLYPLGTTCSNTTGASYSSSYDVWGNVTTRMVNNTSATLSYDVLNDFVQWTSGNNNEWHVYDASGQRTLRRSTGGSGTTMTVYAFGLEEYVYDGAGNAQSNLHYYYLGGRLLGSSSGTSTQFFVTDALGSVLSTFTVVGGSAVVQGNQLYGPYGNSRYTQGSMGTNKGFTGYDYDALTGLNYANSRYYDPAVGRFLSADSAQGNGQGIDPYNYVGGSPENTTDPSGQCPECIGAGLGFAAGFLGDVGFQIANGQSVDWGQALSWGITGGLIGLTLGTLTSAVLAGIGLTTDGLAGLGLGLGASLQEVEEAQQEAEMAQQEAEAIALEQQQEAAAEQAMAEEIQQQFAFEQQQQAEWQQQIAEEEQANAEQQQLAAQQQQAAQQAAQQAIEEQQAAQAQISEGAQQVESIQQPTGTSNGGQQPTEASGEGPCSFTSDTPVMTDQGQQAIGTLQPGEKVEAYNQQTQQMEEEPIVHVWVHPDNDLLDLTITSTPDKQDTKQTDQSAQQDQTTQQSDSEVVHTNKKHPFLTTEQGFVPAGDLVVGMHIVKADGSVGVLTGWQVVPGSAVMYNLEVAQDHTFTIGNGQWIVHNSCSFQTFLANNKVFNSVQEAKAVFNTINRAFARDKLWDEADGSEWRNDDAVLPGRYIRGNAPYEEWTVHYGDTEPGVKELRGGLRVLIGRSNNDIWFTRNHYGATYGIWKSIPGPDFIKLWWR